MLCLVSTVKQAEYLQATLKQRGENINILYGKSKMKERLATAKGLQDGSIRAVICTTIWDEGMDIPALKKIILGSGGKSQVKLLQRLGRGLRIHKDKKTVEIIDFQDNHHPMVRRHAVERLKRYREEGFDVSE